ncbi:hypothetical protein L218DRAFT_733686 [Marasmius fiardii PR-910]|nr:hypothetical protein L218DRAFT_733686 [Marasmius fiardii PR-910]
MPAKPERYKFAATNRSQRHTFQSSLYRGRNFQELGVIGGGNTEGEDKLAYMHRQLEELEVVKQKLEIHILHLRSNISTWRRVPVEIWETIFAEVCFLSSIDGFSFSTDSVVLSPLVLSHVCSHWRSIATGYSQLWSSINVDISRLSLGCQSVLRIFLENSSGRSIDLRIMASGDDLCTERGRTACHLLTRHFFRSNQLVLTIDPWNLYCLLGLFRGPNPTFHDLSFFCLLTPGTLPSDQNSPFGEALRQAPNLMKVYTSNLLPCRLLPYAQLTSLEVPYPRSRDIPELFIILRVSRNLCFLSVGLVAGRVEHVDNLPHYIEMPSLHTLVVGPKIISRSWLGPPEVTALVKFLSLLVMPSISTLNLTCDISEIGRDWPPHLLMVFQPFDGWRSPSCAVLLAISGLPYSSFEDDT